MMITLVARAKWFADLGFLMLGYTMVGQIQKKYPDFQKRITDYGERTKKWKWLSPIRA